MNRRYDFDWLRVFGAVMVVIAHCAVSLSPWTAEAGGSTFGNLPNTFSTVPTSKLFSELTWNLNLWLMPLFMLLAGASAWYTLGKRSNREYLRERLVHVGIPLVILILTFAIPSAYMIRRYTGAFNGSLLDYYAHYFDGIYPNGNFAIFHLWFLAYLLTYMLLTLPLFRFLRSDTGRRIIDKLARVTQRAGGIYLFALPLVAVQLALSGIWSQPAFPALANDGTRFAILLLVFIFGYILNSDARFQTAIARQWLLALLVALATSAVLFVIAWPDDFNPYVDLPLDYSGQYTAFWTLFAVSSWSWLVVLLGFGQRFLNVNRSVLKRAGALSYPIYLLHPILWIPAMFFVTQWQTNPFIDFLVLLTIVLGGTLALIAFLGRWRVMRFVLGLKAQPGQSVALRGESDVDWRSPLVGDPVPTWTVAQSGGD